MSVLDDIVSQTRSDLSQRKAQESYESVAARAAEESARRPAGDALSALRAPGLSVIAEVKRSSPSVGRLSDIPDPAALAQVYAQAGAAMISVLTEPHRFDGSLADLVAVRAAVTTPILRKDFIVDAYQVAEARAAGADAALLIVAALSDEELSALIADIERWGMTALVEVHDGDEARRAQACGARVVGVNARNLATLEVDPLVFGRLAPILAGVEVLVAESGITSVADAAIVSGQGAHAVLVGQALVQADDPAALLAALRHAGGAHGAAEQ